MGTYELLRWTEMQNLKLGLACKCKKNQRFLQPCWEPDSSSAWGWRGALRHIGTHTDKLSTYRLLSVQVLAAQLWSRPSGNKVGRFFITCLYQLLYSLRGAKTLSLIICRLNQTVTLANALGWRVICLLFIHVCESWLHEPHEKMQWFLSGCDFNFWFSNFINLT